MLNASAAEHGIVLKSSTIQSRFRELLGSLQSRAVILVDEYDKPILHYIGVEDDLAEQNRETMRNLYSVLKPMDGHIRFLFITGITRFSKTSLFSDMNHLDDISMNGHYACICGYTQAELDSYFGEDIDKLALRVGKDKAEYREEVRRWYNGYRWDADADSVYNPFSILKFVTDTGKFSSFWFDTGLPTFLLNTMDRNGDFDFDEVRASFEELNNFSIRDLQTVTLMFQAGYLTIKELNGDLYTLVYPNWEVRRSLLASILGHTTKVSGPAPLVQRLREYFERRDLEEVRYCIDSLLENIPYVIFSKKEEKFYQSVLVVAFQLLGCYADAEVLTARGRIDVVLKTRSYIYVMELKVAKGAEVALEQIRSRAYERKFHNDGREVICIGINFEDKAIKEFVVG
jgi:hypothetical protein